MARGSVLPRSLFRWAGSLALFALSGLLAVGGMAFVIEVRGVADTRQPLFDNLAAVCGPHIIGQSFVATAPNLDRIDLWLAWSPPRQLVESTAIATPLPAATPSGDIHTDRNLKYRLFLPIVVRSPDVFNPQGCDVATSGGNGAIIVSLKPSPTSSTVIATATLRLDWAEDPATPWRRPYVYQSFTFPPVPDSAGRTFYLSVEAPASSATAPLLARYHHSDAYPEGSRYLDGIPIPGDLAFRVHYRAAPLSDLRLLWHRLAHDRPVPFNWSWLYPLLLAVYVGSFTLVIRIAAKDATPIED